MEDENDDIFAPIPQLVEGDGEGEDNLEASDLSDFNMSTSDYEDGEDEAEEESEDEEKVEGVMLLREEAQKKMNQQKKFMIFEFDSFRITI